MIEFRTHRELVMPCILHMLYYDVALCVSPQSRDWGFVSEPVDAGYRHKL